MTSRTAAATAVAAFVAAAASVGCTPRQAASRVSFWGLGREGEVVKELVGEFERRTGIGVDVQQVPWTAAHEKLLTAVVGRQTPDLAQMGNTWIPEFAAIGALEPISARVAGSAALRRESFFPGSWETGVVDGEVFGVPWYVDARLIFYRKDLLARAGWARPPRTWTEWKAAMRAVVSLAGPGKHAILVPTDEWQLPVFLALEAGSPLLRDGGRYGAFREPAFRKGAELYVELFESSLAPPLTNSQLANSWQQFGAGDFSMWVTGPWNVGEFRRRLPAGMQDSWATAPMPASDESRPYPGVTLAGGASLVLFSGSPRKEAAFRFLEYLSEPATQRRFWELTGDLPSRREPWDDPALADDPKTAPFRVQLDRLVAAPRVPEWERIAAKVWEQLEPSARGVRPLDASLASLDAEVDRILEKRRWMLDRRGGSAAAPAAPAGALR